MLKKILDKKVDMFKNTFPEHKVSKKTGSLYHKVGVSENKKVVVHTGKSVTKNTLAKLGTTVEWVEHKSRYVYLLTPKGRLMVSRYGGNFSSVTLKGIRQEFDELSPIFFTGKKYEWMKDYSNLWNYKFFQGFNSLGEAKKFLGFSFLSDADFIKLFGEESFDYLQPMILSKNKEDVVRLYRNLDTEVTDLLRDYIALCNEHSLTIEIPAGRNKLKELHDTAMFKVNEKNAENYSKEYRYDIVEKFTKVWEEKGLVFRRLSTPYDMYLQGLKQSHCIGTNYATTLHRYAFYTFIYEGEEFDIQINQDGAIAQFYGKRNKQAPEKLRKVVTDTISFVGMEFKLLDTKPGLKNYPMLQQIDGTWLF